MTTMLKPTIKKHVYNNDRHAGAGAAAGASKAKAKKKRKNNKHASIIPDIIEERRKSSSTGEIKIYKYKKGKYLGKGGFARCYTMTNMEDGHVYAGKVVSKSSLVKSTAKELLIAEIKIHKHLNHRHIVKFEHFFEDKVNVYILLEICTNSTMMELVKKRKRLSEPEARYYTLQMIDALRYLHRHNVIHRDMKLGNLFLNKDMEIRVGDLGLSAKLNDQSERKKTICGTPNYIAPEIIAGKSHSFEVDVWSLGVILFTMLFGKPPFETKDVKSTYRKIRHGDYSFPSHSANVSKEAKSLVASILQLNPEKRPTLDEMLCHEWFTGCSAVIPKTLPKSALTIEPNICDLECQNLLTRSFALASGEKLLPEDMLPEDMLCKEYQQPSVWVTRWVDYTSKYGLGYMLANGSIGVYFNDSTKIVLSSNGNNFEYMERTSARAAKIAALKGLASPEAQRASHTLTDFPTTLTKKVTLLKHFKSYLKGQDESRSDVPSKDEIDALKAGSGDQSMIYVKKWVRTRHAILFRMSNRTVQVAFFDKTEIILASQAKLVTYVDKSRKRTTYSLYEITRSKRSEIQKRLKYTKDILQQLISGKRSSS